MGIRRLLLALVVFGLLSKIPAPEQHINNEVQPVVSTVQAEKLVNESFQTQERPAEVVPTPAPEPVAIPVPAPPVELPKSKTDLMNLAGIQASDQAAVDYIVQKESSWNHLAVNRSSGATGLCQSLPASKMASAGADYMTNPVTQLKWCASYANTRYGSWWSAHAFWLANTWW